MEFNVLRRKDKTSKVMNHCWKTNLKIQNKVAGNHPIEPVKENLSQRFLLTDWKIEKRSQKKKSG